MNWSYPCTGELFNTLYVFNTLAALNSSIIVKSSNQSVIKLFIKTNRPVSQFMQHRMVGCLMDNELETMWHEAVVVYFRVKVKVTPWQAFTGNERTWRCNSYPFATPQWKEVSCHHHGPPALPPVNTGYPLYKKLCFKVISQNSVGQRWVGDTNARFWKGDTVTLMFLQI
jgi:hypothetical protein